MRWVAVMFDFDESYLEVEEQVIVRAVQTHREAYADALKAGFDVLVSLLLLFPLALFAFSLLLLNPFFNAGPLLFLQRRMGRDCKPFIAVKFRTMRPEAVATRGAFDGVETDRISWLGYVLRKTRIDELPQIINVLKGEMSLIGPRPDAYSHAQTYLKSVPGYAQRHRVLPGISGYAQTEVGYVEDFADIARKVEADLYYIANYSFRFDLWITWRTLCVVLGRQGQ